jgi:hypothetical protein
MKKCQIILPVKLYDGTHPQDLWYTNLMFLVRDEELEELPEPGSAKNVVLANDEGDDFIVESKVVYRGWSEQENAHQIMLEQRDLHVNWWRCGVADMFARGWQWAQLQIVPPPQQPTY